MERLCPVCRKTNPPAGDLCVYCQASLDAEPVPIARKGPPSGVKIVLTVAVVIGSLSVVSGFLALGAERPAAAGTATAAFLYGVFLVVLSLWALFGDWLPALRILACLAWLEAVLFAVVMFPPGEGFLISVYVLFLCVRLALAVFCTIAVVLAPRG